MDELNGIEEHINSIMQALTNVAHDAQMLREMTLNMGDPRQPPAPAAGTPTPPAHVATDIAADAIPTNPPAADDAMNLTTFTRAAPLQAGHPDLPEGLQIPSGWTLVPLERFDTEDAGEGASNAEPAAGPSSSGGQTAGPTETVTPETTNTPNWGGSAQMFNTGAAAEPAAEQAAEPAAEN